MMEEETRQMRGHSKKIKKKNWCLEDIKKYSFPHRTVDIWNGLKEEVLQEPTYINSRKCWIYRDMETGHFESCSNPV